MERISILETDFSANYDCIILRHFVKFEIGKVMSCFWSQECVYLQQVIQGRCRDVTSTGS
ncbi:MAG: hypothetical protein V8S33_01175 [Intestinibacter bartlettii]